MVNIHRLGSTFAELLHFRTARFSGYTRAFLLLSLLIGGFFISPTKTEAQGETTSAIVGQVTDATNAAIPGATVRVKNHATGLERSAKTDEEGRLPSIVLAGIPGKPSTETGFGASTYTVSPPTGLLGVGLGADSSPRMIALHALLEF
jgi:hypothetical protein